MSVTKCTRDALELQSEDGGYLYVMRYPGGRVSFVDGGSEADFGRADLLVLLAWLADALGVERHVPPPTCGNVDGWSETACLLAPGHGGMHEGLGTRWVRTGAIR